MAFVLVALSGGWGIGTRVCSDRTTVSYRGKTYRASVGLGKRITCLKCARCHDLRPVYLFTRDQPQWDRYLLRMQDKDPALLTDEDCANGIAYLLKMGEAPR